MRSTKKTFTIKKDPAGESGSAKSTPLPGPGPYHSEPVGAYFMTYQEQYKNPLWQKKRLYMLEESEYRCHKCGNASEQLHVHHLFYEKDRKIWEYDETELIVLCSTCHENWHYNANRLMYNIAYHITNCRGSKVNLENFNLLCNYFECEGDELDALLKKAEEYNYPWL